ncbi:hypothetical protein RQP46_011078 [Phenoliferia psychrophenolica]
MTREDEAALLRDRDADDWNALLEFPSARLDRARGRPGGWIVLERKHSSERFSVRDAFVGVTTAIASFFVSFYTSKAASPTTPYVRQRLDRAAHAAPSVCRDLAKPSFQSGPHSAAALLAVGGSSS